MPESGPIRETLTALIVEGSMSFFSAYSFSIDAAMPNENVQMFGVMLKNAVCRFSASTCSCGVLQ